MHRYLIKCKSILLNNTKISSEYGVSREVVWKESQYLIFSIFIQNLVRKKNYDICYVFACFTTGGQIH